MLIPFTAQETTTRGKPSHSGKPHHSRKPHNGTGHSHGAWTGSRRSRTTGATTVAA